MAHDRNVNPFRVTCVGHSFISRLKSFTDGDGSTDPAMFNLSLDPERYQISFIGVPGAINPFSADGVHPHAQRGMPKYVRSVRHAILFFEQKMLRS